MKYKNPNAPGSMAYALWEGIHSVSKVAFDRPGSTSSKLENIFEAVVCALPETDCPMDGEIKNILNRALERKRRAKTNSDGTITPDELLILMNIIMSGADPLIAKQKIEERFGRGFFEKNIGGDYDKYFHRKPEEVKTGPPGWAKTLNLTLPTTREAIKKSWRSLVQKHHPDVGGTDEKIKEINSAYEQALKETTI